MGRFEELTALNARQLTSEIKISHLVPFVNGHGLLIDKRHGRMQLN